MEESEFVSMVQILFTPDKDNNHPAIYYASKGNHYTMVWIYLSLLIVSRLLVASRKTKEKVLFDFNSSNDYNGSTSTSNNNRPKYHHHHHPSTTTTTPSSSQVIQYTIPEWLYRLNYYSQQGNIPSKRRKIKEHINTLFKGVWGITIDSRQGRGGTTAAPAGPLSCFCSNKVTLYCLIQSIMHCNNPFSIFLSKMDKIIDRKGNDRNRRIVFRPEWVRRHAEIINELRRKATIMDHDSTSLLEAEVVVVCNDYDDVVVVIDDDHDDDDNDDDKSNLTDGDYINVITTIDVEKEECDDDNDNNERYLISEEAEEEDWVQVINDRVLIRCKR